MDNFIYRNRLGVSFLDILPFDKKEQNAKGPKENIS